MVTKIIKKKVNHSQNCEIRVLQQFLRVVSHVCLSLCINCKQRFTAGVYGFLGKFFSFVSCSFQPFFFFSSKIKIFPTIFYCHDHRFIWIPMKLMLCIKTFKKLLQFKGIVKRWSFTMRIWSCFGSLRSYLTS